MTKNIPEHIKVSLNFYVEDKLHPGDFLYAVLSNDLFTAFSRGDVDGDLIRYIYNDLPLECWGSKEKVETWLKN